MADLGEALDKFDEAFKAVYMVTGNDGSPPVELVTSIEATSVCWIDALRYPLKQRRPIGLPSPVWHTAHRNDGRQRRIVF